MPRRRREDLERGESRGGAMPRRQVLEREARPKRRSAACEARPLEKKARRSEAPSSSRARAPPAPSPSEMREARQKRRSAAREAPPPEMRKSRAAQASCSYRSRSQSEESHARGDPLDGHQQNQFPTRKRALSSSSFSPCASSSLCGSVTSAEKVAHAIMAEKMREIAAASSIYKEQCSQLRQRQMQNHNITVESSFGNVDDGSIDSLEARKAAMLVSKSVVSLSSFSGEKRMRVCSGFVMRWNDNASTCLVLTSTTLVRSSESDNCSIPDLRVKALLPSGHTYNGLVSMVDFHYNIAMVEITSDQKLPEAVLCHDVIDKGEVLALGRFYDNGNLVCSRGQITKQNSTLECSELLVSSCNITMAGVGGPVANYRGYVIGINCYEKNQTPFLSMAIVSKCLAHHQNYGQKNILPLAWTTVHLS